MKEYGVNFYRDKEKIYILNSVYRYFDHRITFAPLGTVSINSNKKISKFLEKIKKEIIRIKIYGKIKLDIGIKNNKLKIIEISPRFHGEIDTSHLFNINGNSLSDFYFNKLKYNNEISMKRKNKLYYGYFTCYKQKSKTFLKEIFGKNNIKFLKILKRDNFIKKNIKQLKLSTKNIWAYAFYETNKIISDKNFKIISHQINSFKS